MSRIVKKQNVDTAIDNIDVARMQGVISGELEPKWVSDDEILAIKDKLYDALAGKLQTHLGVLTVQ